MEVALPASSRPPRAHGLRPRLRQAGPRRRPGADLRYAQVLPARGEDKNPHERQRTTAARREEATAATMERLDPSRRRFFGGLLRWTRKYVPLREDALADVGLAWPLMRRMLLEVGRHLAAAGAIEKPDGIFWMEGGERPGAASALDAGRKDLENLSGDRPQTQGRVAGAEASPRPRRFSRRAGWFMGLDVRRWMPARLGGTGRGYHRGRRRQLRARHGRAPAS